MENLISVQGLCKQYGDFALDHIDLTVPAGEIVGLIGENGAGKTTTIRAILGLIRPDGGSISLMGAAPGGSFGREDGSGSRQAGGGCLEGVCMGADP